MLYTRKVRRGSKAKACKKFLRNFFKCLVVAFGPVVVGAFADICWYKVCYERNWTFEAFGHQFQFFVSRETEPLFHMIGVVFSIFAAVLFDTVWKKRMAMNRAVRENDMDTFLRLRDETISPLVHTLMIAISAIIIAYLMLQNRTLQDGLFSVFVGTYLLALFFFVIQEMDHPLHGVWIIEEIKPEWRDIEFDVYLKKCDSRHKKAAAAG